MTTTLEPHKVNSVPSAPHPISDAAPLYRPLHSAPEGTDSRVVEWVEKMATLTLPDTIVWCDGSVAEYDAITKLLVEQGTLIRLNPEHRPFSFLARSDPNDVARVEDRTFICSEEQVDAGPTNHWVAPAEMRTTLDGLFEGSMRGRTMYVVPFSMGPLGSPFSKLGVQVTDSPYVVASMRIMTRMGSTALDRIRGGVEWVPAAHTVGAPLTTGQQDVPWPCNSDEVHQPLSGDARDLVLRLGLRRQRHPRQEILRAAYRFGHRAGRGLARRAHAHPSRDEPRWPVDARGGGVPQRVRQDQLRDAEADSSRLERRNHRR